MIFAPNVLDAPRLRLAVMVASAGACTALLLLVKLYKLTNVRRAR